MDSGKHNLNIFFSDNNFVGSFLDIKEIPNKQLPEFCFIGRSNVGKSSMINAITKLKKIAKTSKKPGRTQSVNLFQINKKLNIVDLPGYGYAKISLQFRDQLSKLIQSYLVYRNNLIKIYVLLDCKVGVKDLDIDTFDLISSTEKKFSVILTKIDKCADKYVNKEKDSLTSLMKNYPNNFSNIFSSSSKKNLGITNIQKDIFNLSKKHEI